MSAADDTLPLTQYLVVEVLAARYRAGDPTFTFPNRAKPALRALEAAGLVWFQGAPTYGSQLAGLTDAGLKACLLEGYRSTWQQKWEDSAEGQAEMERDRQLIAQIERKRNQP